MRGMIAGSRVEVHGALGRPALLMGMRDPGIGGHVTHAPSILRPEQKDRGEKREAGNMPN